MADKDTYITLGQFLKLQDYVSTGGEAKQLIHTFVITVNEVSENRRGKKLRNGDVVVVNGTKHIVEL